jgi:hypothetical protein
MKRLDEVSEPSNVPFPYGFFEIMDKNLGKNIDVPTRFETVATKYDYGTYRS